MKCGPCQNNDEEKTVYGHALESAARFFTPTGTGRREKNTRRTEQNCRRTVICYII